MRLFLLGEDCDYKAIFFLLKVIKCHKHSHVDSVCFYVLVGFANVMNMSICPLNLNFTFSQRLKQDITSGNEMSAGIWFGVLFSCSSTSRSELSIYHLCIYLSSIYQALSPFCLERSIFLLSVHFQNGSSSWGEVILKPGFPHVLDRPKHTSS